MIFFVWTNRKKLFVIVLLIFASVYLCCYFCFYCCFKNLCKHVSNRDNFYLIVFFPPIPTYMLLLQDTKIFHNDGRRDCEFHFNFWVSIYFSVKSIDSFTFFALADQKIWEYFDKGWTQN